MVDKTEIVKINVDVSIPSEIRKVDHISNTQKAEMARRIASGEIQIQKVDKKSLLDENLQSRFQIIFDILSDRMPDKYMTKEEIVPYFENDNESSFMSRFIKYIRSIDGGIYQVKKVKRQGKVCYMLKKAES
jgi:hypothetical protein